MNTLYKFLLEKIESHRFSGIPKRAGEIHPHYGGYSIANLPASICRWLSVPPPIDNPLSTEILDLFKTSYQHVILLLVDGLRLDVFNRFYQENLKAGMHRSWTPLFEDGNLLPLTSISPSTTSTALTTLWTGRLPAEHGIIGYELFLKEFGLISNMIFHSVASFNGETGSVYRAGFNPDTFLPMASLGSLFKNHKVKSFAFQHASISSSGLSQMLLKEVRSIPFESLQDLWQAVESVHTANEKTGTYTYIYWGGLDTISHHEGPDSSLLIEEWNKFANGLSQFLNTIRSHGSKNTLFILTADHGQISTHIHSDFDLHNHRDFTNHLVLMPTGESRLPFIFIKDGHEPFVSQYLVNHWDGQFSMMRSEDILSAGLLGNREPHQITADRMGSHVVFPTKNAYWWWVNKENHLLGRHGGLSDMEMLVPFFTLEI